MPPESKLQLPEKVFLEVNHRDAKTRSSRLALSKSNVKYLQFEAGTFDHHVSSLDIKDLPSLRLDDDSWNVARISRDGESDELQASTSQKTLAGIENTWHSTSIDVFDIDRTKRLAAATWEAMVPKSAVPDLNKSSNSSQENDASQVTVIAKLALFSWGIPGMERETRVYQVLQEKQASDLGPRFLGHVHENGRAIGFLMEKVMGHEFATIENLDACKSALGRLHKLGILHGDLNQCNFLVGRDGVKLIDFEDAQDGASAESRDTEMKGLPDALDDVF